MLVRYLCHLYLHLTEGKARNADEEADAGFADMLALTMQIEGMTPVLWGEGLLSLQWSAHSLIIRVVDKTAGIGAQIGGTSHPVARPAQIPRLSVSRDRCTKAIAPHYASNVVVIQCLSRREREYVK